MTEASLYRGELFTKLSAFLKEALQNT